MVSDASDVDRLVDQGLERIADDRVLAHIGKLRVEPRSVLRNWRYGQPGERFVCWTVIEDDRSNIGIAYCERGFGPKCPWGLVSQSGTANELSIGMDCEWYRELSDAYFDSLASDLPIWRVFKREGRKRSRHSRTPITDENTWEATWRCIMELRAKDPGSLYDCDHSIEIKGG